MGGKVRIQLSWQIKIEQVPKVFELPNKRNNLYYVLLYHSEEKGEGLAYASFKAKNGLVEETWILYYIKKE